MGGGSILLSKYIYIELYIKQLDFLWDPIESQGQYLSPIPPQIETVNNHALQQPINFLYLCFLLI